MFACSRGIIIVGVFGVVLGVMDVFMGDFCSRGEIVWSSCD